MIKIESNLSDKISLPNEEDENIPTGIIIRIMETVVGRIRTIFEYMRSYSLLALAIIGGLIGYIYLNDTTGTENSSTIYLTADDNIWWSPDWKYRKEITIDNTKNSNELTNYVMEIFIDSTYFNFTNINSNASDIRFIDADDVTQLNHWLENDDKLLGYNYPTNPIVIPVGDSGAWDEKIREVGNILYEPFDTGREYKIFYSGYDGAYDGLTQIGYAYSNDAITWTKHASPITSFYAEDPYVIKNDSTYYLYYEIKNGTNKNAIGLATTTNITENFTESVSNPVLSNVSGWEGHLVGSPVVWIEESTWFMIYEGVDTYGKLGLANSTNGKSWTKYDGDNPILDVGVSGSYDEAMVVSDEVLKIDDTYYLFYHVGTYIDDLGSRIRMAMATSTNKVDWTKSTKNPVQYWRAAMILDGTADWKMFAGSKGKGDDWGIGSASMGYKAYVRIPTIPASATKTIYMYYGRTSVNTTSNITSTFIDSDDFEYSDSILNHGWYTDATAPSSSIGTDSAINKLYTYSLKLDDSSTQNDIQGQNIVFNSIPEQTETFIIEFYLRTEQRNAVLSFLATNGTNQSSEWGVGQAIYLSFRDRGNIKWYDGSWQTIGDYASKRWYEFKLIVNVSNKTFDIYIDGVLRNSSAGFRDTEITKITAVGFMNAGGTATGIGYVDGFRVRNYNTAEPSYSMQSPDIFSPY